MTNKTINITVHEDDVRRLANNNFSYVCQRFGSRYSNKVAEVASLIENGSKDQSLNYLSDLIAIFKETIPELEAISSYLNELDDSSSADTEVLEDLPDLEKDRLGIDGRSK